MMKHTISAAVASVLTALALPAGAGTPPAADSRIEVLQQAITKMQAELDALKAEQQHQKQAAQEAPRPTVSNARFGLKSADGSASITLRALAQADVAHYAQDSTGSLDDDYRRGSVGASGNRETNGARDLSDGLNLRRARLGIEGTFEHDFGYRFTAEFGGSGTEGPARVVEALLSYSGFKPLTLQLGVFAPPTNLDGGTSSSETLFMERATPAEIARSLGGGIGRTAIGVHTGGSRWMAAATLTGRLINSPETFDSQSALLARAGGLIVNGEDYRVHLGASGTWVIHPADAGLDDAGARYSMRLRDRPELRVDGTRLIDTGAIDAAHVWTTGIEFGATWRNFFLQAEGFNYGIERRDAPSLADPRFGGWYAQASWILTGEQRRYNTASGAFQSPRPIANLSRDGGRGAWELALRYSHTDLDFRAGIPGTAATADAVRGGVQDIWTIGLNFYANPNLRWQINYLHIDVNRLNPRTGLGSSLPFGAVPATPPVGVQIGQQLSAWALRTQYVF
jgi:phosphate-selective porin OprO/OprP